MMFASTFSKAPSAVDLAAPLLPSWTAIRRLKRKHTMICLKLAVANAAEHRLSAQESDIITSYRLHHADCIALDHNVHYASVANVLAKRRQLKSHQAFLDAKHLHQRAGSFRHNHDTLQSPRYDATTTPGPSTAIKCTDLEHFREHLYSTRRFSDTTDQAIVGHSAWTGTIVDSDSLSFVLSSDDFDLEKPNPISSIPFEPSALLVANTVTWDKALDKDTTTLDMAMAASLATAAPQPSADVKFESSGFPHEDDTFAFTASKVESSVAATVTLFRLP